MSITATAPSLRRTPLPSVREKLCAILIEDDAADAELVLQELRRDRFDVECAVVITPEDFRRQVRAQIPDVVLADYNLGAWRGMEALEILRDEGLEVPLILVSGAVGEMTAVDCVKEGATDYVLKDHLMRLPSSVRRALREKAFHDQQKRFDARLWEQKYALDQHAIVATTDVQGTITYANDKFCAISQYSRDELLGQNHRILNSGYHPVEFFRKMYQTIGSGKVWHGDIRNRAKDGSTYWVATTIVPFVDGQSKPTQYIAIRTDITQTKRAEEIRGLLAAVVDSSDDAIISKTLEGTISAWNAGAEKMFGYSSREAVGKPMTMLLPADRIHEESEILARIGRGERVEHFETVRVRKDGTRLDVSVTISPIKDSSGTIIGASKISRDITARKRSDALLAQQAEELAKKVDALARSNADLEQFAYVASHDLQEPLRMVAAYTQLLSERYKGRLDENADKFIGYASEGALRMQVLINDLLAFSRVGRKEIASTRVDCNAVMQEVRQTLAAALAESGAVLTFSNLPAVWADRTQLGQVFQNLVGNAIKFRGKTAPSISVRAEKEDREWVFSVSDNGIGIAPDYAERIFEVFQRLHSRTEYPGNGIGLAICKKIVQRYGGRIWVESQVGCGSTFKFTLPLRGPEPREEVHP